MRNFTLVNTPLSRKQMHAMYTLQRSVCICVYVCFVIVMVTLSVRSCTQQSYTPLRRKSSSPPDLSHYSTLPTQRNMNASFNRLLTCNAASYSAILAFATLLWVVSSPTSIMSALCIDCTHIHVRRNTCLQPW